MNLLKRSFVLGSMELRREPTNVVRHAFVAQVPRLKNPHKVQKQTITLGPTKLDNEMWPSPEERDFVAEVCVFYVNTSSVKNEF